MNARLVLALLSGFLLAASFPNFGQGWLAWVGFVPLLLAVRGRSVRAAACHGWIAGVVFFLVSIYWIPDTISNFTSIPPILAKGVLLLLAAVAAYSFALLAGVLEWLAAAGISRVLAAPILWVVLEWMRGFVIAEFPWNLMGYSQLGHLPMAQVADLGGVYLVSAVLVLSNAALAEAVSRQREGLREGLATQILLAALCPILLWGYGHWRLAQLESIPYRGSIRVGVAQGNIAQDQKWDTDLRDRILAQYLKLTNQAVDAGAQLVAWPEAALPFYFRRDMRSMDLVRLARERGVDLLVGAPGVEESSKGSFTPYNQAWLIRADGDVVGPYNKIQLVPFGEYIPLGGLFGLIEVAVQSIGEFGRGTEHTIFETAVPSPIPGAAPTGEKRPARFATLICYEGIFPSLAREFAAAGAEFLVNISNDAWYGDTSAPQQHLRMAAMRAIENRIPLIRSTNTGISAYVTDTGAIGPTSALFQEAMLVEAVLLRDVPSFYRSYGDVFLHVCQMLLFMLLLVAGVRRRKAS